MPARESRTSSQDDLDEKRPRRRRWSGRKWRRLWQVGCLPMAIVLACVLVVAFNLLFFRRSPSWVSDSREYLVTGRLTLSLAVLVWLQALGTWVLGLLAAGSARRVAPGQAGTLPVRLAIARRRMRIPTAAVLVLRVAVLLVLVLFALYAYTRLFGHMMSWDTTFELRRVSRVFPFLAFATLVVLLLHWLAGPFLRVHYSTALGALAATWSRHADERLSLALSARLGAGMVGALAILWGYGLGMLVTLTVIQPRSFFPDPPEPSWRTQTVVYCLAVALGMSLYMIGQVVLPRFYVRLARRRLAK